MSAGFVYLVGAGPGDPRLLTVRAHELLGAAEIVAYDELVAPAILALAPPDAERLAVGRRAGHGATPFRLHPAVLARARAGRHVVRLKCGDPLVFGRGGEEAAELVAAGVGFEIVPGISAALGAAAYAGIPLTHRDCATSVRLATGRAADGVHGETVVLYMAGRRIAVSLAELVAGGCAPTTPAAWIGAATTAAQHVVVGTVADLAGRVAAAGVAAATPALLIVGEVVARRTAWWAPRPLAGRRVLVARARPGRSRLAAELRVLGAEVIEAPILEIEPLPEARLDGLDRAPAVAFGCAAGVDAVLARRPAPVGAIVAIGGDAARALARHGVRPTVALDGACREALTALVRTLAGARLVVVTAAAGRPALVADLAALGIAAETLAVYRATPRRPRYLGAIDLLVLPSSSAVHQVLAVDGALRDVPAVAIGPRTEAAARALGVRDVRRAGADTIAALVARVTDVAQAVA